MNLDMFSSCMHIDRNTGLDMVIKPDPGMDVSAYGDQFGYGNYMNQDNYLKVVSSSSMVRDHMFNLHGNSTSVLVSPKKRKADKVVSEKEKKLKGCSEGDSKITCENTNNNSNNNSNSSKTGGSKEGCANKSKVSEVKKPDYIHVRARRGEATDSHSLAERVRREKISKRMKYLQELVPGCNKITGKAGMLDEIINYVQSLQKQVEFLSMKLATINQDIDFNINNTFMTEMFEPTKSEFPALGCSSASSAYFDQLNSLDQMAGYCELDMGLTSAEMGIRRSISAPLSIPEAFIDSSCFSVISSDISTL